MTTFHDVNFEEITYTEHEWLYSNPLFLDNE